MENSFLLNASKNSSHLTQNFVLEQWIREASRLLKFLASSRLFWLHAASSQAKATGLWLAYKFSVFFFDKTISFEWKYYFDVFPFIKLEILIFHLNLLGSRVYHNKSKNLKVSWKTKEIMKFFAFLWRKWWHFSYNAIFWKTKSKTSKRMTCFDFIIRCCKFYFLNHASSS